MTTTDEAPPTPRKVFAGALAAVRGRQGLSLDDLAARVKLRGGRLDRTSLSKIETGARGVSLDEAILLAVALEVSPLHLFIPREDDAWVRVTPAEYVTAATARRWIRGTTPLKGMDDRVYRTEVPESEWAAKNTQVISAQQEVEALRRRYRVARELADTITAELADLDREDTRISFSAMQFGTTPAQKQIHRLEARLAVAYDQVAEAKVSLDEALERLTRVKAEEGVA